MSVRSCRRGRQASVHVVFVRKGVQAAIVKSISSSLGKSPTELRPELAGDETSPSALGVRAATHSFTVATLPPSTNTSVPSAGRPSIVPWNLASSPVLLCFVLRATL